MDKETYLRFLGLAIQDIQYLIVSTLAGSVRVSLESTYETLTEIHRKITYMPGEQLELVINDNTKR